MAENEVRSFQHLRPGPEIAGEQYLAGLAWGSSIRVAIALVFLQEYLRLCQAEAIDALLDVAHSKKVPPFTGNSGENAVLNLVGVLVLVHHDLHIALCDLPGQLRGAAVGGQEQLHGVVLLVGEIRYVAAHLLLLQGTDKLRRQVQQRQHGRSHDVQVH